MIKTIMKNGSYGWVKSGVIQILMALLLALAAQGGEIKSLMGEWRFELDPEDKGLNADWQNRELADSISLPNTTTTARILGVHPYFKIICL